MSPVFCSHSTAGFSIRRRATFSSASLFPACPDRSPNTRTQELAPLPVPGSIVPDVVRGKGGADCPPPAGPDRGASAPRGGALRSEQDFRKDAAAVPGPVPDGRAPLVGIARLASISPIAATRRKHDARAAY